MALTLRSNGNNPINIVTAQWFNDFYNALTGVMTDQPYTLNYRPGASTATPVLGLETNGNAPLLIGYNSGGTNVFQVDQLGDVTTPAVFLSGGPSGTKAQIDFESPYVVFRPPESGATALGFDFQTWTGSANPSPFSIGGALGGLAHIDDNGIFTGPEVIITRNTSGNPAFLHLLSGNNPAYYYDFLLDFTTGQLFIADGHNGGNVFSGTSQAVTMPTGTFVSASAGNADTVILKRTAATAQQFNLGIDSSAGLYIYDNNAATFAVQNVRAVHTSATQGPIPTLRTAGGGNSGYVIWVGTTDPGASASEGDIWIDA